MAISTSLSQRKILEGTVRVDNRPELAADDWFETNADRIERMAELKTELEKTLCERRTDEWITILVEKAEIPAGLVFKVEDSLSNGQIDSRGSVTSVEHPEAEKIPVIEYPFNYERSSSGLNHHRLNGVNTMRVFSERSGTSRTI